MNKKIKLKTKTHKIAAFVLAVLFASATVIPGGLIAVAEEDVPSIEETMEETTAVGGEEPGGESVEEPVEEPGEEIGEEPNEDIEMPIGAKNRNIRITAQSAASAPLIDGRLDFGAYRKIHTDPDDFTYAKGDFFESSDPFLPWSALQSLAHDIDFYMAYDEHNLYLYFSGSAAFDYNGRDSSDPHDIWTQTSIQIALASPEHYYAGAEGFGHTWFEFGFARNSLTGELLSHVWSQSDQGRREFQLLGGRNFDVSNNGDRLAYEAAIPWQAFLPRSPSVKYNEFGLNFIYTWSDGGKRNSAEYSYGTMNHPKDASQFARVTLTGELPAESIEYEHESADWWDIPLLNHDIRIETDNRVSSPPVMDGRLDAGLYSGVSVNPGDFGYWGTRTDYMQDAASGMDVYLSYDENNLYMYISGDASSYYYNDYNSANAGDMWDQSCIQVSLASPDAFGGDRLEFGLARNSLTGELLAHVWSQSSRGRQKLALMAGENFGVLISGGRLSYEIAVPWAAFLPENPSAGNNTFGLNFIYTWFADGVRNSAEYSAGVMAYKEASHFARVTLTGELPQQRSYFAASPTASDVIVDGNIVSFDAYLINWSNYFKLRDLAYIFNGSEKQFGVEWDAQNNAIALTSGADYMPVGGEMSGGDGSVKAPARAMARIILDGNEVVFTAYLIDGNNYFKLRDVMYAFNIFVGWDEATGTITLDTSRGYAD